MRAEVARSCLLLDRSLFAPGMFGIFGHHFERMKVDIAVRTISRAKSATDAPVFDNHFQRIAAANRTDRAANHAERIAALAAARRNKVVIEAQSVAYQSRNAVMSVRAGIYASVAPRAVFEVEHQQTLCLHQSLRKKLIDRHTLHHFKSLLICETPFLGNHFKSATHIRKL